MCGIRDTIQCIDSGYTNNSEVLNIEMVVETKFLRNLKIINLKTM